jgi:hypothetical protein
MSSSERKAFSDLKFAPNEKGECRYCEKVAENTRNNSMTVAMTQTMT